MESKIMDTFANRQNKQRCVQSAVKIHCGVYRVDFMTNPRRREYDSMKHLHHLINQKCGWLNTRFDCGWQLKVSSFVPSLSMFLWAATKEVAIKVHLPYFTLVPPSLLSNYSLYCVSKPPHPSIHIKSSLWRVSDFYSCSTAELCFLSTSSATLFSFLF